MRPTTKDLAKAAGVSLATVDRVLNERPGVRIKTVKTVNEAIDRIGFVRNQSAANLARQRLYRIKFLLPERGGEFLQTIVEQIEEAQHAFGSDAMQISYRKCLSADPHRTAQIISDIRNDDVDGIAIMTPESPQVRDTLLRLAERGVHVVQFISGQHGPHPFDFVGINNYAAGETAGRLLGRFAPARPGKLLVVAETMNSRDSAERRLGFDAVIARDYPHLTALPSLETHGNAARTTSVIQNAYAFHDDIVGVYVLASEGSAALKAIFAHTGQSDPIVLAHERTDVTEALLSDGQLDATIAQNPGHLVRSAIRTLKARCDGVAPHASQERIRIEILMRENLT